MTNKKPTKKRASGVRGAALAEFVIAVVPLLLVFFCFYQLSILGIMRLMVKYGTSMGTRAAAVLSNEHSNTPDQPPSEKNWPKIRAATRLAMGSWAKKLTMPDSDITIKDESDCNDPYGPVTVSVKAVYTCNVPLGKLICGFGLQHKVEYTFTMPHEGARYETSDRAGGGAKCN